MKKTPVKLTKHGAIEQPARKSVRKKPNNKTRELMEAALSVKHWLKRGKENAISARALGRRMRCSKGAAERRLNEYVKNHLPGGAKRLKSIPVREGDRGPEAIGFYL